MSVPYNKNKIKTCAVICAKNEEKTIRECIISALKKIDYVIVVCDRCDDNTESIARSAGATTITKHFTPSFNVHLGHRVADARNVGLSKIPQDTKYVVFLDADMIIPTNYIDKCIEILENDSSVGFVGIELDGHNVDSGGVLKYDILRDGLLGNNKNTIFSCAREGTCMVECIKHEGFKTIHIPYKNTQKQILRHTSENDSWLRSAWGALGIGFAQYEMHKSFLHLCYNMFFQIKKQHSFFPTLYPIGFIQGMLYNAKRIKKLQNN